MNRINGLFSLLAPLVLTAPSHAQWRVIDMHPTSYPVYRSEFVCGDGAKQIGLAEGSQTRFWFGSHGSQCPPEQYLLGGFALNGCSQDQLVGARLVRTDQDGSVFHAWAINLGGGSVDLHPEGIGRLSFAYDCDAGMQVGCAQFPYQLHAILWHGSASDYVDLNPDGYDSSQAFAICGDEQVGIAYPPNDQTHAGVWNGTAESFVDLHPTGGLWSEARATSGVQQAGSVTMIESPTVRRASLWQGSPESWVDLHPAWATRSAVMGADLQYQVGWVELGSPDLHRAAAWVGSVDSFVDLHSVLPSDYERSEATAVSHDKSFIYVCGWAENVNGHHAMLWVRPRFSNCLADWNQDGFVNGDDFDFFAGTFEAGSDAADFNRDCFVNGDDFDAFAEHFEAGC